MIAALDFFLVGAGAFMAGQGVRAAVEAFDRRRWQREMETTQRFADVLEEVREDEELWR